MQAMVLNRIGAPLQWSERPDPLPGPGEIRIKISACGVCRTDLHVVDGELPNPRVPIIPGHEIVGRVDRLGANVSGFNIGERVGVPWLGHTCQTCACCASGHENLCDHPEFTGFTRDGGYATMTVADGRFAFPLGEAGEDAALAPLLCAGLIGWRAFKIAGRSAGQIGSSASMASAPPRISWRRWRSGRAMRSSPSPSPATRRLKNSLVNSAPLGRRLGRGAARKPRRGDPVRAGRRPCPPGAEGGAQGRRGGLRRHPHERHSEFSLFPAVGGAATGFRRQSHPARRPGIFAARAAARR